MPEILWIVSHNNSNTQNPANFLNQVPFWINTNSKSIYNITFLTETYQRTSFNMGSRSSSNFMKTNFNKTTCYWYNKDETDPLSKQGNYKNWRYFYIAIGR